MTATELLATRQASPETLAAIYDAAPPAELDFMLGRWKGFEVRSGHFMDGLLELTGWYGKLFESPEEVHPLLFYNWNKQGLFAVNPLLIPLQLPFPKTRALGPLMQLLRPILATKRSKARLRMIAYRGKMTATMVYDHKAIMDHFVQLDEDHVLGVMDLKGDGKHPYFFGLERDETALPLKIKTT